MRPLISAAAGPALGVAWLDEPGADDVVVRLSRGGGLPAWCPDVHGLALRHPMAAGVAGRWRPFGWLVVGGVPEYPPPARPDPPLRFDPTNAPPGLATYPWVAALRDPAYAAARAAVPNPGDPGVRSGVRERTP